MGQDRAWRDCDVSGGPPEQNGRKEEREASAQDLTKEKAVVKEKRKTVENSHEDVSVELPVAASSQSAAPGSFGAPSASLGISPAGSGARRTAQLRLYLAPLVARWRSG